jgi:membrane protease YdiL (CAAX protease family)
MASTPRPITAFGGILLVIIVLALLTLFGGLAIQHLFGLHRITAWYIFIGRTFYWLFLLGVWLYASRIERQEFLLWHEIDYSFWVFVLSLIAITAAIFSTLTIVTLSFRLLLHKDESSLALKQMIQIFKTSPLLIVYTALTAGVTEELIFRGYLLPRLNVLLKSPFWAIAISSLIFGLAHLGYGTIINFAAPFIIGLAQAFYYYQYRNIKVIITFHLLWDLAVLFLQTTHA